MKNNEFVIDLNEERYKIFMNNELKLLLERAKNENLRDFIIFSLLIVTGARISQILTLKMESINLTEKYIETKVSMMVQRSIFFFFSR